jgi:hypothetical protein
MIIGMTRVVHGPPIPSEGVPDKPHKVEVGGSCVGFWLFRLCLQVTAVFVKAAPNQGWWGISRCSKLLREVFCPAGLKGLYQTIWN